MEVPALRELMPGRLKFVFGLANDELGYIIPKSEWDEKPPRLYGSKGVYGEINSCGPDTGRLLHAALAELCRETKAGDRVSEIDPKTPVGRVIALHDPAP